MREILSRLSTSDSTAAMAFDSSAEAQAMGFTISPEEIGFYALPAELSDIDLKLSDGLQAVCAKLQPSLEGTVINRKLINELYLFYASQCVIQYRPFAASDFVLFGLKMPKIYAYFGMLFEEKISGGLTYFEAELVRETREDLARGDIGEASLVNLCLVDAIAKNINNRQLFSPQALEYILNNIHSGEALIGLSAYYEQQILSIQNKDFFNFFPEMIFGILSKKKLRALELEMHYCRFWLFFYASLQLCNLEVEFLTDKALEDSTAILPLLVEKAEARLNQFRALALKELFYLKGHLIAPTEPNRLAMRNNLLQSLFCQKEWTQEFNATTAAMQLSICLDRLSKVLKGESAEILANIEMPRALQKLLVSFRSLLESTILYHRIDEDQTCRFQQMSFRKG